MHSSDNDLSYLDGTSWSLFHSMAARNKHSKWSHRGRALDESAVSGWLSRLQSLSKLYFCTFFNIFYWHYVTDYIFFRKIVALVFNFFCLFFQLSMRVHVLFIALEWDVASSLWINISWTFYIHFMPCRQSLFAFYILSDIAGDFISSECTFVVHC